MKTSHHELNLFKIGNQLSDESYPVFFLNALSNLKVYNLVKFSIIMKLEFSFTSGYFKGHNHHNHNTRQAFRDDLFVPRISTSQ